MSDILIKNIRLEKPYTDIRIMPDGTYYHPFKCFDHEYGEYEVLPDSHGRNDRVEYEMDSFGIAGRRRK